jgi:hypothetical protein
VRESTRHRQAFDIYYDLGSERSIRRLRIELRSVLNRVPTERTLFEWSRVFGWQFRIDDIESEARESDLIARIEAIKEMQERHAREGLLMQQKGTQRLSELAEDDMNSSDAIRAIVEGARLERLARGEPTEHVRNTEDRDPQLERLTDDALEQLIRDVAANSTRTDQAGS